MRERSKNEKTILYRIHERFSQISNFAIKNKIPRIFVSDISSSLFCEWRKILEIKHGKPETEEMILGTKIHEEYFAYELESIDELEKIISRGETIGLTTKVGFIWEEKNQDFKVMISGEPDLMIFSERKLKKIVELKTRRTYDIFSSDILQLGIYALCIEKMTGENLKDLQLEIRVKVVSDNLKEFSRNFYYKDIRDGILDELKSSLDFWLGKRDPKTPTSKNICFSCYFREICDRKLV